MGELSRPGGGNYRPTDSRQIYLKETAESSICKVWSCLNVFHNCLAFFPGPDLSWEFGSMGGVVPDSKLHGGKVLQLRA